MKDFTPGVDTLQFDADLWGGPRNFARLNALTDVVNGDLVFDFGSGDGLTLEGITSITGLLADIELV